MVRPCSTTPIPAVLTKMPSPFPLSTTLVSPVTSCTFASTAVIRMDSTTRRNDSMGKPSSNMNAELRYSGRAPHMARSLTVPLMASGPISPPGKNNGLTTYESVVKASRAPAMFSVAPSWRSSSRSFLKLGSNKPSNNSCMRRPPPPCASCTRSESLSGVGHCNGKFLTSAMCLAPHVHQVIAAQPAITVISSASSLGRHHRRPQGMVRGAAVAVRRAILGLLRALHHQAADALWILLGRVSRHTKPRLRIKLREFGGQPQTALRYFTDAAPLAMYHSKDRRHQLLRRHIPFLAHRPRVLVLQ